MTMYYIVTTPQGIGPSGDNHINKRVKHCFNLLCLWRVKKMKKLSGVLIHLGVLALIIAGGWLGVDEAKNIALFFVWMLVLLTFITLMAANEEFFKDGKNENNAAVRIIFFAEVLALSALGSFFTATVYALAWIGVWVKRANYVSEAQEE